jgi:exonuclease III
MKKIAHKSTDFQDAEEWNIRQQIEMTPEERQTAAKELQRRVYGDKVPDVREAHRKR